MSATLATPLATSGDRFVAALLDGVIGFAVFLIGGLLANILGVLPDLIAEPLVAIISLAAFLVPAVVIIVGEGRLGQTYGKHLMNMRVVSTHDGSLIGVPAAFGRSIVRVLGSYVFGLGLAWILWDRKHQGWHDKAVSSIVVKDPSSGRMDPVTFVKALVART